MDGDMFLGWLAIVLIVATIAVPIIMVMDTIRDNQAQVYCQMLGYEDGSNWFWSNTTVCSNVVAPYRPEKREYFFPNK